ncbi:transcription termination factor NusA [Thermomicrobium sp. CFH 73360]|uniref:transcription termination factor NusA n=1 Tax=Thermomicrobium sp. CFH 73360 TaxID=2951987 RepID=UPI002077467A|nr:transcription termination factor NusA [Thermomicrobium sp. CFH 73360]MCM8746673.1 transcription termination factor NusA [Thermomicrobium sp. CFH 73360]
MKSDLYTAIAQIAAERGIPREAVMESVQQALRTVYKKATGSDEEVEIELDVNTGRIRIFAPKRVVETVRDPLTEISIEEARKIDPRAIVGDIVRVERQPTNFGRIAAQTAKQVILQRIRDFERETIYNEFIDRVGEVLTGTVQRVDPRAVILSFGKAEAIMPAREQIPGERYRPGQRLKVYLVEVTKDAKGPQLLVSRTHPNLIKRLLELEVPEVASGAVEVMAIAREPGQRSKVAVAARQDKVDPVGACVGVRGVRIQSIVTELSGEKIDVIEWSSDIRTFIANALSPAKPITVILNEDEKVARVVVPPEQMSQAIGKDGQNARLAYKLTGWRIDIKDPDSLKGEEALLVRAATSLPELPPDLMALGRQPRLVRADGTFSIREREFGPLPSDLIMKSVDVEIVNGVVNVYYDRELRARYDFESGRELPLTDDETANVR